MRTFESMHSVQQPLILVENHEISSEFLERKVGVDFFLPTDVADPGSMSLLLINDGQNMEEMGLAAMLTELYAEGAIKPLLCVAIYAGKDRRREYGVSQQPDYLGRGDKAGEYTSFVLQELLPYINRTYGIASFRETAFAGFSLGGLMALDIVWNHPAAFSKVGVFSGSLWWRDLAQEDEKYDDDKNRIMHQQIRKGNFVPGLTFFFQCGNMDETMDRNNNGIIDSIEDTQDLIKELEAKGYDRNRDIYYLEMSDGKHDIPTWGRAMREFLMWGWKR